MKSIPSCIESSTKLPWLKGKIRDEITQEFIKVRGLYQK